jgi:hypothetical protein
MPEIECPQCGHRALSVATRCPRCGHEFPPDLIQPLPSTADRHWARWALMGAAGLAFVIAVGRFGKGEPAPRKTASGSAAPVVDTAPRDTLPQDSLPPTAAVTPRPAPPPVVQPAQRAPTSGQEQRYATVFVNVRRSPSPGATTVAVLNPGDAVLVDSLRRGWYRISRDGRVLGYADRRFLSTIPR